MSNRTLRVNELIQRELSDILHKRYQTEAVALTITGVKVAPDLRDGRVYVSIMGDAEMAKQKLRWLKDISQDIRFELGRRIVLKYMPRLTYALDTSTERGNRILQVLDDVGGLAAEPPPLDDQEGN